MVQRLVTVAGPPVVTAMTPLVTSVAVSLAGFPARRLEVFGQRRPVPPLLVTRTVPGTVPMAMARTAMSGSFRPRIVSASLWAPRQTPPPRPGSPPELLREIGRTSPSPDQVLRLVVAVSGEAPGPVRDGGEILPGHPITSSCGVPVQNFVHRARGDLDWKLRWRPGHAAHQGLQ